MSVGSQAAGDQTDKPCLEVSGMRQGGTRLQQQFELAVSKDILVGVAGGECLAMPVGLVGVINPGVGHIVRTAIAAAENLCILPLQPNSYGSNHEWRAEYKAHT